MSNTRDFEPPKITKSLGSSHPINQIKDSIMNYLVSLGFEILDDQKLRPRNLTLTC